MPKPRDSQQPTPKPSELQRLLVLVEQIGDDVRRVAEGHATLERQLTETRRELLSHIDRLEVQMKFISQEIAQVKQAVLEIDRRLETHEQAHAR